MLQTKKTIIGLTGGIGSGKTVVSNWFATQKIDIIDADVITHQIVAVGSETLNKISLVFGKEMLMTDGSLNRKALRERVFKSSDELKKLEAITHPAIRKRVIQQLTESTSCYSILSAPLLLESKAVGLAELCDCIMVVDVTEETQLNRASSRDGQSPEQINAIMQKQLKRTERNKFADIIIHNDGSLDQLYTELPKIHEQLLNYTQSSQ